jgi:hypothetical protein
MQLERALIVRQPYLNDIYDNGKIWEMRTSITHVRGLVGLIESGSGLITGSMEIIDCLPSIHTDDMFYHYHKVKDCTLLQKWKYPWVIRNAKRFEKPIPYTHPKGAVIWVKL